MGFNYRKEKQKFNRNWKRLEAEYRRAGMSEDAIAEMKAFDEEVFRSDRRYLSHTQKLPSETMDNATQEDMSTLFLKFEMLSCTFDESAFGGRYGWIETLSNELLVERLRSLSAEDLEFLTAIVIDGLSQSELSKQLGVSQQALSKRMVRIKKIFEKTEKRVVEI